MKRYGRKDANHNAVAGALLDIGCSVLDLSPMGRGVPDLLVASNRLTALVEVKDGAKPPSKRALTPAQKKFFATWRHPVLVVTSVDEALALFGARVTA